MLPTVVLLFAPPALPAPARICLAPPLVEATPGKAADASEAVRTAFEDYLASPTIAVTVLKSKLPSQMKEEARAAGCPWLLRATFSHVHKSGGSGLGTKVLGGAVQGTSYAAGSAISKAVGGETGRVVGSAASGAANAVAMSTYSATVSARDEITLTVRLEDAGGRAVVERTSHRKAASDGEDLLSPLVQKVADEVATAATRP